MSVIENLKLVSNNPSETRYLWMTREAHVHIKRLLIIENRPVQGSDKAYLKQGFRICVDSGGCKGFQYVFSFDTVKNCPDIVLQYDNSDVIVDEISLNLINESLIEYQEELIGSSILITNPNATALCGCNNSFTI